MADKKEEKLDVIDFVINVLKEHEKKLDEISDGFGKHLETLDTIMAKPSADSLSMRQATLIVEAIERAMSTTLSDKTTMTVLLQDFMAALNRRNLVPNKWVDTLIIYGEKWNSNP